MISDYEIFHFRKINFFSGRRVDTGAELLGAELIPAPSCRRRDVGAELSGAEMTPTHW